MGGHFLLTEELYGALPSDAGGTGSTFNTRGILSAIATPYLICTVLPQVAVALGFSLTTHRIGAVQFSPQLGT